MASKCGMPLEYCEFSPTPEKCMEWLGKHLPDEFEKLKTGDGKASISTSADPVPETASGEAVTNSAQKPSRQTRGGKANTTSVKKITTKQQIQLFRSPRGKNKFTTSVVGLSTFGICPSTINFLYKTALIKIFLHIL
ncbi:unnamed protein product [Protopolystoma xenopodis]|uniref:DENR N-terminal domain-containing protein n=1 Tax=Protopolystoma xenopodis TaxID=117903 RepID=A0A448WDQ3_9PLAT|nr:unnamed protein product [Protopolystoma xenopodis]